MREVEGAAHRCSIREAPDVALGRNLSGLRPCVCGSSACGGACRSTTWPICGSWPACARGFAGVLPPAPGSAPRAARSGGRPPAPPAWPRPPRARRCDSRPRSGSDRSSPARAWRRAGGPSFGRSCGRARVRRAAGENEHVADQRPPNSRFRNASELPLALSQGSWRGLARPVAQTDPPKRGP